MRQFVLFLLILFFYSIARGQSYQKVYTPIEYSNIRVTKILGIPNDTAYVRQDPVAVTSPNLAVVDTLLMLWDPANLAWKTVGRISGSGIEVLWGNIAGDIQAQADLIALLDQKEPLITPSDDTKYFRGDKTWAALDTALWGIGDARYLKLSDTALFGEGGVLANPYTFLAPLYVDRGEVSLDFGVPTYNANKLQGYPITPGEPAHGAYLIYDSVDQRWESGVGAGATLSEVDPVFTAQGVPKTRQLTINGTAHDLSADASWTISPGTTYTAAYPSYINSNVIGIDTALMTTKDRVKAMIDSAKVTVPTLYTANGTLTSNRRVSLNGNGLGFYNSATAYDTLNASYAEFVRNRGKAHIEDGWVMNHVESTGGNHWGRFQSYRASSTDSVIAVTMFSRNNQTYNWKYSGFESQWDKYARMVVNVNWKRNNLDTSYKGIAVVQGDGLGTAAIQVDLEVLPDATGGEVSLSYDPTTKQLRKGGGGGGSSSLAGATDAAISSPTSGQVLSYNGTKWANTNAAKFQWTGLKNWDKIRASISGGDTTFVNYSTTYTPSAASLKMLVKDTVTGQEYHTDIPAGGSGGTVDSIRVLSVTPTANPGYNVWFNSLNHHLYVRNDEGTQWIGYAPADSLAIVAPGGGPAVVTWGYTAALTQASDGLINTNASGHGYGRSVESFGVGNYVEATIADATNVKDKLFGFGTATSPSALADVKYGFIINNGNQIWKAESGTYTNTGQLVSTGSRIRVYFSDASTVKLQKWDGSLWQDITSLASTGSSFYCIVVLEGLNGALSNIKWE